MLTTFFTVLGPSGVMTQSNAMSAKGLFFFLKSPLPALGELLPFPGNPGVGAGGGHANDCPPALLPGRASSLAKPEGKARESLLVSSRELSRRRREEGRKSLCRRHRTDH